MECDQTAINQTLYIMILVRKLFSSFLFLFYGSDPGNNLISLMKGDGGSGLNIQQGGGVSHPRSSI